MQKQVETFGKNVPELKLSSGGISVTVWRNERQGKQGQPTEFSTISLQRSYKDNEGNWKNTSQLRVNDLPKAALALNKAYEYLIFREQEAEQKY